MLTPAPIFSKLSADYDSGYLHVQWKLARDDVPVAIYLAERPEQAQRKLIKVDVMDNSIKIPITDKQRKYVFVQPSVGDGRWVADRVLPLERGRNFRDLGGYRTESGQYTRWGVLYRSGTMAHLTDNDIEYLRNLDIAVVCDFRNNEEREGDPTPWSSLGDDVNYLRWNYSFDSEKNWGDTRQWMNLDSEMNKDQAVRFMLESYGEAPFRFSDYYKGMFENLLEGNMPFIFHCTAGKDRTGLAAGLILLALGVPRETVFEDYKLSDLIVDYEAEIFAEAEDGSNPTSGAIARMAPETRNALFRSDPMYLERSLDSIESRYGSIPTYLEEVMGLDGKRINRLRELYLEK